MNNSLPKRSDDEKFRLLQYVLNTIPHLRLQGASVHSVEGNKLTLCLPYRDELIGNPTDGTVHTGALSMLLDTTLGTATCTSDLNQPALTPTLDLRIDHIRAAPAGVDIFATAWVYRATPKVLFAEGFAWYDQPENVVARATGNFVPMKPYDPAKLLAKLEAKK